MSQKIVKPNYGKVGNDTTQAKRMYKEFRKLPEEISYPCGCKAIRAVNCYMMRFCKKHSPYKELDLKNLGSVRV